MKIFSSIPLLAVVIAGFCACDKTGSDSNELSMTLSSRQSYSEIKPEGGAKGDFSYTTDPVRLNYFGSSHEECPHIKVNFPAAHGKYRAAYLSYVMCAWGEGPAAWDMTTIISIRNKKTGEWYEFARAFTPYGGSFGKDWSKTYYMDVTDFLPMMEGETEFSVYYCGWDATETRAHAVKLGFDLYEGAPQKNVVFTSKVYDSSVGSIPEYRRCWPYGVHGYSIEDASRLGSRTIRIPAGVRSAVLRVDITGHGMDYDGVFPDRKGYRVNGPAEFDYQDYSVKFNGNVLSQKGHVFEVNSNNYPQAGTYYYDRAGWGPGKPANLHYWEIRNIPEDGTTITLDIDFESYVSGFSSPNEDSNAYYIIEADLFGYDR